MRVRGGTVPSLLGALLVFSGIILVLEWRAVEVLHVESFRTAFPALQARLARGADSAVVAAAKAAEAAAEASLTKGADVVLGGLKNQAAAVANRSTVLAQAVRSGFKRASQALRPASSQWDFPAPPEVRHSQCVRTTFDTKSLPTITMVIPYLHEQWEQIKKTVNSVLAYTPPELLDEILFIDDANTEPWKFHENLTSLDPKVKVHRNEARQGLIRAKVTGAASVSSPVIIFMEPHCIVGRHWLEPLLVKLQQSTTHSIIAMPTLDIIPENNFNDYKPANYHIGGFDWSLTFNWMTLIKERNKSYTFPEPYPTPALSGGVFGIYRDYWERMGTYDTNMTEWGGEHIEMSLRIWRCGGRIEIVPCSHIGHVFRAKNPYEVHVIEVLRNLKRAALVWLDNHLDRFYSEMPSARRLSAGDITERLALKERLQCKSMDWYIENIYPELMHSQPRKR